MKSLQRPLIAIILFAVGSVAAERSYASDDACTATANAINAEVAAEMGKKHIPWYSSLGCQKYLLTHIYDCERFRNNRVVFFRLTAEGNDCKVTDVSE